MAEDFLRHRRKTHRGLGSLRARSLSAVLPSPRAMTGKVLATPEGPFNLWSGGARSESGSPTRKAPAMGRLTDGYGTAGLPSLD
jgi:hypothetical protein